MKRIFSLLLLFALLCGMITPVQGAVSLTTNAAFFGAFTLSKMPAVQSAVNAGNYTLARQELLNYYTNKFASMEPSYSTAKDGTMVYLAPLNTFAFSEGYLGKADITTTEYSQYLVDLGTNRKGVYVLSMLHKTEGEILMPSREASSMVPQLIVTCSDGSTKTINATADTYVRAGSYASKNYGSSTTLYIHDDYSGTTGSYLPYGDDSKRVYIKFDASAIPSNATKIKLSVYAKKTGSESSLRLHVFHAYSTTWTETGLTWSWLVSNNGIGHFSWNGISGGFDWKKPTGTPSEWLNYNTRFYEVTSLVQAAVAAGKGSSAYNSYMTHAKNLTLDFITDAGAGGPGAQDLCPANRLLEFPYIYKHLLDSGKLTADDNVKLLAWVYDEANHLSNNSIIFSSSNGVLSDMAYTNHGFWHVTGFYQAFSYFPEFAKASTWRNNYNVRQPIVVNSLFASDGSYNEVSFGYPFKVIGWGIDQLASMRVTGDTSAAAVTFRNQLIKLTRYMMDCTMPNGMPPYWGQGGPGATKTYVNKLLAAIGDGYDSNADVQALKYYVNQSNGIEPAHSSYYPKIKIVTDRTGWTAKDSMLFMSAHCGGNHGHRDALAVLLYYSGRPMLADTGMTSYDSKHAHYGFQNSSTHSHNTIEIDGKAQTWKQNLSDSANWGSISISSNDAFSAITSWTKSNNNDISTKSVTDAGVVTNSTYHSTDFTHTRDLSYLKGLGSILVVTDKVVPADSTTHTYTQNWHSTPYSNPSIASDVYGTGRTNFASGPNLIIAQAYNTSNTSLNASITTSLPTGYDATATAATTKYFRYTQKASGTVTYQTVLYPVASGATATVTPLKLSMSNTPDSTALATRIAIEDSAQPRLKVLYHYHSFESTPTSRSFGGHTTDASTVAMALDKASNGSTFYAALSNGSSLTHGTTTILGVSQKVSDIAATLNGTTLEIESSDGNATYLTITANFSGQTVKKVTLNGKSVEFTQTADGTVTVGTDYLLAHFYGDPLLASGWTGARATVSVNTAKGVLSGSMTGGDPYIKSEAVLNHPIQSGDLVELRIKVTPGASEYSPMQVFYTTAADSTFTASKCMSDVVQKSYANDTWYTLQFKFPASMAGQTLTALRVDPIGTLATATVNGSYAIDYIYVGAASKAPSAYSKTLFFDFTDDTLAARRYADATYGDRNYDNTATYWNGNITYIGTPTFDGNNLCIPVKSGGVSPYIQTTTSTKSLNSLPLSYTPSAGDYVQIRFKLENLQAVSGATPSLRLYYIKNNATTGVGNNDRTLLTEWTPAFNSQFMTVSAKLNDTFTAAEVINALRVTFTNVTTVEGKTGTVYIDYIAIGPANSLPEPIVNKYTVTFANENGTVLTTQTVSEGGTASYTGSTPTKAYDGSKHYSFAGWVDANGKTAVLSNITANLTVYASFTGTAHSYTSKVTTAATCINAGVKTYTCSCGRSYTEAIAATGHSPVTDAAVAPTCTKTGLTEGSHCSVCNAVIKAQTTVPTISHSYTSKVTTAATCTKAGVRTYTCTACGNSYTEAISATGHTAVTDKAVAPTCTKTGLTEGSHCSVCNAVIKAQSTVPATGHSYTSKITTAATCTKTGIKTYTCGDCGDSYTEVLPMTNHSVVTDLAVAPTCLVSGLTEGKHCSVCGLVLVAQEFVARLGHDYSYTNDGTDTHTAHCGRCDKALTEAHEFTDGLCICGAVESTEPVLDESIQIYHTLDLASDISITFAVPMSALTGYDSYYLECVLPEYEGNVLTGTSTVQIQPVANGTYYYFTLTGITAVRMGDMVEAVVHMTKGNRAYYSNTDRYSVATYAYAMLNSTTDSKMLTLCADLLRYGAEAQSFKQYRTDALVDASMTDGHRAYLSDINALHFTETDSFLGDLDAPMVTWVGKTLDLGSKVGMKFVFNTAFYSGDTNALSMRVTYAGGSGEPKTVTLTGAEVYNAAKGQYSFTFCGLLASELRTAVDVAIFDGEMQLSETIRYSAETYASKAPTPLEPLTRALFAYSDSAKAYFTK